MKVFKKIVKDCYHGATITIYGSHDMSPLGVQVQNKQPVIYFLNDPTKDQEFRLEVLVAYTGQDFNDIVWRKYLGTAMLADGAFVLHFFTKG